MTTLASTHDVPRPRAAGSGVRAIPAVLAGSTLCAYIASIYVFKTWYIAATGSLAIVMFLVILGALRTRGLLRATWPVVAYFAILLCGALWAEFPRETVRWVLIDSIEIVVVVLFFIAARNAPPLTMSAALLMTPLATILVAIVMFVRDPESSRLANYALLMMPLTVPFIWSRVAHGRRRWWPVLLLLLVFGFLFAARSRAPLGAAVFMAGASSFLFRRSFASFVKQSVAAGLLLVTAVLVLWTMPLTQLMVRITFARFLRHEVAIGSVYIPAESADTERTMISNLARELLPGAMPLGLGYLNFAKYYLRTHGNSFNLHNMFMTWLLEGGVLCLALMVWLLLRSAFDLRRYARYARTLEERDYAKAIFIALCGIVFMGMFHQVHQTPNLWFVLALCAACGAEARDRARARSVAG